jgi:hypothetical protein
MVLIEKRRIVEGHLNETQSRHRLVETIYFGKEWHFGYFDNVEL